VFRKHEIIVDPHTADGIKVGLEQREPGVPLLCLETALPVKFSATIREALGREPERPAELVGIEKRPQRVDVVPADVAFLKSFIEKKAR
jgi:threonine synthase